MPDLVQRVDFTEDLLPEVQDFNCGDEVWATEVSAWITGTDLANSVLADLARNAGLALRQRYRRHCWVRLSRRDQLAMAWAKG